MIILILFILPLISFFISYRQFKNKGFVFNNAYLFATKEERQKMDMGPYFRQSGYIFLMIGIVFLLEAIDFVIKTRYLSKISLLISFITVIYAIASSIMIEHNH